ncbi:MAG: hypothetical protein IH605_14270 [Burkholderiales bacterium]|nr:hypothetical protein [Burkholderiales bacterium]
MSGIAGVIHFDGAPVEPGLVEAMTNAMAYRGPDGINHWARGSLALGQCMLHTTAESLEETQPLTNEDESLVLVIDGRADNWEELRRELLARGAVLRNRSDAELVLRAYETWGRKCVSRIEGDFALLIWDARRRVAFCARDRMGNKPFHYHWNGRTLAFASDLHPILALPWVEQVPNEGMLAEYLAGEWYSRDETLWRGILRLVAAHRMEVDVRGLRSEQYWEPDLCAAINYSTDQEYAEHYRELLFDSVRRLSRSHRPVAIEVSGGLDSSAVFCVAERLRRASRLPAPAVEGYTLAFSGDDGADELTCARAVGEYLGVPIHEVPSVSPPLSWYAQRARDYREFPGFPNASMSSGMRQQAAARGSRVALTGEGGDEWLDGSRAYYADELAQRHWAALYDCFSRDASAFGARQAVRWLVRDGCFALLPPRLQKGLRRLVRAMRGGSTRDACYWLAPRLLEGISVRRGRSLAQNRRQTRNFGQRELFDVLCDAFTAKVTERGEREGAHYGVEVRDPLRNPRIVQFAFSTPARLRLSGDWTKAMHRQALREFMPAAVLERKSKAEFSNPFRAHLDRMQDTLTRRIPQERPDWVDQRGMARLFRVYQSNPQFGWPMWILWAIYACDKSLPRH